MEEKEGEEEDGEEEDGEEGEQKEGSSGEDITKVLRMQMENIRRMSQSSDSSYAGLGNTKTKDYEANNLSVEEDSNVASSASQSSVYAVHLNKLLRLAEEAISNNE